MKRIRVPGIKSDMISITSNKNKVYSRSYKGGFTGLGTQKMPDKYATYHCCALMNDFEARSGFGACKNRQNV